ncbi:MAG TPA: DUF2332 family protein [Deinococcales bacterium]|nr:DUF2332 family protein [Deinococcales bacterium]
MPRPATEPALPPAGPAALARAFQRYGEAAAAGPSPLSGRVALAVAGSPEALVAISRVPARKRQPALILAALHDLALAGLAPGLAAAHAAADGEAAAGAAIETLVRLGGEVAARAARRQVRALDAARCAVLYPAVAEAARRAGAGTAGLIDLDGPASPNLQVDRVWIDYRKGPSLGDPASPVRLSASVVGKQPIPERAMPRVAARIGLDRRPLDPASPEDARWLRACLPPDRPDEAARLDAILALAAPAPPLGLAGEVLEALPAALARVPSGALPVVTTTWALSRLAPGDRRRFLEILAGAARERPVVWVSVEGVGVAPGVPTLGDRPASGHNIVGLALLDRDARTFVALGRCWSRGRMLAWLAGP